MAWWKKKDIKGGKNKPVPYVKCGHQRRYKAKNGSTITVICTKQKNHWGGHD